MKFKQFFTRKRYSIGSYFMEQGVILLTLCLSKKHLSVIQYSQYEDISGVGGNFRSKSLCATIPNLKLLRKKVRLNAILNNNDIMAELSLNQSEYFSGISEKLIYAFERKRSRSIENNNQELMVYAAREEELEHYHAKTKKLGLALCCVEPENIAVLRVVFFYEQSLKEDHYYAALFFIRQDYRLVVFTKQAVIHESVLVTPHSAWSEIDVPLVCLLFEEAKQRLQPALMSHCFLLSVKTISSEFLSALTIQQSLPFNAILPFQRMEFYVKEDEALPALGSALRDLYVRD